MEKKIDYDKNEAFLDILKNDENFIPKVEQNISLITTDTWLAQLGSRKNN